MSETQEQREARWAAGRARIEAYRASPEGQVARAARIDSGRCLVEQDECVTHGVRADLGHYLDTRPEEDRGHDPVSGIAYND